MMRKTLILAIREYMATVKTKGFVIGLIIAPVFMCGSLIAMMIAEKRVDTSDKIIAVIDRSSLIADNIATAAQQRNADRVHDSDTGKKIKPAYVIEIIEPNDQNPDGQRLVLSDKIRNAKLHAFVEIGADIVHPNPENTDVRVAYYTNNPILDDARNWINQPINERLRKLRLYDAGIKESEVKDLFHWINAEPMGLVTVDSQTGQVSKAKRTNEAQVFIVPFIGVMFMFMMTMMGAMPLLHSVMEEKTQRIAEVLLGSIKPFQMMMGKLLGGVGIALTASSVYLIAGLIVAVRMNFTEYIPYNLIPWFFVFMVFQIIMFGALFAALGSACNDAKEAQSLTPIAMIPMMIPMFTLMPIIKEPLGGFATTLSFIPPCTPMVMLLRQATLSGVPAWQPWVGLAGVIACTLFITWAGGRIFRIAILIQGTPPKLSRLIKWIITFRSIIFYKLI